MICVQGSSFHHGGSPLRPNLKGQFQNESSTFGGRAALMARRPAVYRGESRVDGSAPTGGSAVCREESRVDSDSPCGLQGGLRSAGGLQAYQVGLDKVLPGGDLHLCLLLLGERGPIGGRGWCGPPDQRGPVRVDAVGVHGGEKRSPPWLRRAVRVWKPPRGACA